MPDGPIELQHLPLADLVSWLEMNPPGLPYSSLIAVPRTVALPTGAIQMFAVAAVPAGFLLCDGSAVSRATYADLFALIGTTYGAGNGTTTFNVPDLAGRVPVGLAPTGHTDVATLGNNDGAALASRRPKHKHTVTDPGHTHVVGGYNTTPSTGSSGLSSGDRSATSATGNTATGVGVGPATLAPTDAPAYLVVNFIIKT